MFYAALSSIYNMSIEDSNWLEDQEIMKDGKILLVVSVAAKYIFLFLLP